MYSLQMHSPLKKIGAFLVKDPSEKRQESLQPEKRTLIKRMN